MQTTLLCIAVYSQRTQVDVFADIFVALNKKYPAELIAWLKVLEVNEFPTPAISAVEKDHFMKAIIRYALVFYSSFCVFQPILTRFYFDSFFATVKRWTNAWYKG